EVAPVTEVRLFQAGPVGDNATAIQCTTNEQGDSCGAVICTLGAIDTRGSSELGDYRDHAIFPGITHAGLKSVDGAVQRSEKNSEPPFGRPFVCVCVPSSKASAPTRGPSGRAMNLAAAEADSAK